MIGVPHQLWASKGAGVSSLGGRPAEREGWCTWASLAGLCWNHLNQSLDDKVCGLAPKSHRTRGPGRLKLTARTPKLQLPPGGRERGRCYVGIIDGKLTTVQPRRQLTEQQKAAQAQRLARPHGR
jgi:hypothetical protein